VIRRFVTGLVVALAALTEPLQAQVGQRGRPQERMELEAEIRRSFTRVVRQQVGLSEAQMRALSEVTEKFAVDRRRLQTQERSVRMGLQRMLRGDATPDSALVETAIRQLIAVQRRRVELMEAEQRELAAFMTPVQRARFMALQEQMRRRLEQRRMRGDMDERRGPPR
jgi:hypothetical protein